MFLFFIVGHYSTNENILPSKRAPHDYTQASTITRYVHLPRSPLHVLLIQTFRLQICFARGKGLVYEMVLSMGDNLLWFAVFCVLFLKVCFWLHSEFAD